MGMIHITTNGSFGQQHKAFEAIEHGHADAVAQAIEWLSGSLLPEATARDHELHEKGESPNAGFRRK